MGNENQTLDKTYTSSENSYFDIGGLDLQIFLPQNDSQNPYIFSAFDISQSIDGVQQNAIFIYMKRETDDTSDLSEIADKYECSFNCRFDDLPIIDSFATSTGFDTAADNTLVVIYHDFSDDRDYQRACAEAAFTEVPTFLTTVAVKGNFQTELNLMGIDPKKTGMSTVPKR